MMKVLLSIQTTLVLPIMMKVLFFVNESVIIHSNTDTNDYDESVLHNIIHSNNTGVNNYDESVEWIEPYPLEH